MAEAIKKIILIDDHQIIISGIKQFLKNEYFKIVKTLKTLEFNDLLQKDEIDIIIINQNTLKEKIGGIKKIHQHFPDIKIIVILFKCRDTNIHDIFQMGINGCFLTSITKKQFIYALHKVSDGKFYMCQEIAEYVSKSINQSNTDNLLSDREHEVLKLVFQEYSNKEIASKLFIGERTVESHRKNIFRKTKTKNIIGLMKFSIENKLIR